MKIYTLYDWEISGIEISGNVKMKFFDEEVKFGYVGMKILDINLKNNIITIKNHAHAAKMNKYWAYQKEKLKSLFTFNVFPGIDLEDIINFDAEIGLEVLRKNSLRTHLQVEKNFLEEMRSVKERVMLKVLET